MLLVTSARGKVRRYSTSMGPLIFNPLIPFQEVEAARRSMLRKIYYLTDEVLHSLPLCDLIHCQMFIDCTCSSPRLSRKF